MILCLTINPLYDKVTARLLPNQWKFGRKPFGSGLNMADKMRLIDCQSFTFSPQLSESRMRQAQESLGAGLIQRILCFALYLLGLNRNAVGRALGIPPDTAKSIIKAVKRDGLRAFEDRRMKTSTLLPKQGSTEPPPITLREDDDHLVVDFGIRDRSLKLCRRDPLQMKTVLLSMFNSGLLSTRQVAEAIELTPSHTAALARRLQEQGVLSLADQRQGQKEDFVVTSSVKAELIQQFAVDVITSGRTSSTAISEKLKERCSIVISDRTVRHHLSLLGLGRIKRSLPQLVAAVKKTSNNCSES
jgi:Mn-dependent DtxR family transcriptional regulator